MQVFMQDLAAGAFTYAPPSVGELSRAMDVGPMLRGSGPGAPSPRSVVALTGSLGIRRLATRDVRHFAAVQLRAGRSFELVVRPTHPEQQLTPLGPSEFIARNTARVSSREWHLSSTRSRALSQRSGRSARDSPLTL